MEYQHNNNNNNNNINNSDESSRGIVNVCRQLERDLVKKRSKRLRRALGPAIGSEEKFARAARKLAKMEIQRDRDEKFEMRHEVFVEFYQRSKVCVNNAREKVGRFFGALSYAYSFASGMKDLKRDLKRHVRNVKKKVAFSAALTAAQWAVQKPTMITAIMEVIKILDITTDGFLSRTSTNIIGSVMDLIKDSTFVAKVTDVADAFKRRTTEVLLGSKKEEDDQVYIRFKGENVLRPVSRKEFSLMASSFGSKPGFIRQEGEIMEINDEVELRHEVDAVDAPDGLVAAVAALISSILIGKSVQASETAKAVLKNAGNMGRDFANSCRGFDVARNLIQKLIACIRGYLTHWQERHTLLEEKVEGMDLERLVADTQFIVRQVPGVDIGVIELQESCNYIQDAFDILNLRRMHKTIKLTTEVSRIVETAEREFKKFKADNVQALRTAGDGRKRTPALFDFFGLAGCGKSEMVNQFARDLTNEKVTQGLKWNVGNLVYSQNPNTKHMDGYRGQNIHIQDDAMQGQGYTPENSEALELIRTVSPVEMPVVMASLADKGMLYSSYLILRTTNVPFPRPKEVSCVQALWRRRTRLIKVFACPNKGKSDCHCQKFEGVRGNKHFALIDPLGGVPIGSTEAPVNPEDHVIDHPKYGRCDNLTYYQLLLIIGEDLTTWWAEDPSGKPFEPLDETLFEKEKEAFRHEVKTEEMEADWPSKKDIFAYTPDTMEEKKDGSKPYFVAEPRHLMSTERACCLRPFEFSSKIAVKQNPVTWDLSVCKKEMKIFDKEFNQCVTYNVPYHLMTPTVKMLYKTCVRNGLITFYDARVVPKRYEAKALQSMLAYDRNEMDRMIKLGHDVLLGMEGERQRLARFNRVLDCADAHCEGRRLCNGEISYANQMKFKGEYEGPCVARHNNVRIGDEKARFEIVGEVRSPLEQSFDVAGQVLAATEVVGPAKRWDPDRREFVMRHEMWTDDIDSSDIESDTEYDFTEFAKKRDAEWKASMNAARFRVKVVLYCLGALTAGLIAYGAYQAIQSWAKEPLAHEFVSGDPSTNRVGVPRVVRHQGAQQNVIDVVNKVKANACTVILRHLDGTGQEMGKPFKGKALGIYDHFLLLNAHAFWMVEGWETVSLLVVRDKTGVQSRFQVTKEEVSMNRKNDAAIVCMPMSTEAFKNIKKFFIADEQLSTLTGGEAILVGADIERHVQFDRKDKIQIKDGDVVTQYVNSFQYKLTSELGMCGTAMVVADVQDGANRFIAGIHNAGNGKLGYSRPVTQQMLEEMTEDMQHEMECIEDEDLDWLLSSAERAPMVKTGGSVDYVGIANRDYEQGPARKTDIRKSYLHGKLGEVLTAPAVFSLRQGGVSEEAREAGITPYDAGLLKFSKPVKALPSAALSMAMITICSILKKMQPVRGIERRILTEDEMINGTECGLIPAMDLDTSPGLPWKNYKPPLTKGKKFMFDVKWEANEKRYAKLKDGYVSQGVRVSEDFRNKLELMEERLKARKEVVIVIYENLKDERRKLKHIANAKTRVFDVSPMEFNMLLRKYFGAFNAAMQARCTDMPVAVGIDFNGPQAQELYDRLTRLGTDCIAGDFESWDGCLPDELLIRYAHLANFWYDDEHAHIRCGLIRAIIHCVLVSLNTVARKHQGLPSGIAVTAPMNSVVNWILQLTAIIDILESHKKYLTTKEIQENVELTFWGDDHLVVPGPKIKEWINFMTMKQWFLKHGFGYTDAEKSGKEFEFEDIHDVLYCKRKFKRDELGVIVMPTELSVLNESIQWRRKTIGVSKRTSYEATMNNYVEALSMHGKEVYDREIEKVNKAIEEVNQERMTGKKLDTIDEPYQVWVRRRALNYGLE